MIPAMNNPMIANMINRLSSDPNMAQNPLAQNLITAINTGDSKKGEEIAMNLCKSYGITPEEACKQASAFFGGRR